MIIVMAVDRDMYVERQFSIYEWEILKQKPLFKTV